MLKVIPGAAKDTELYAGTPTWNTNAISDQVHGSYLKYRIIIILSMNFLFWNKANIVKYLKFSFFLLVSSNKLRIRITY